MAMREPEQWAELELGTGLTLLLGWRPRPGEIDARPVQLSNPVAQEMRSACVEALGEVGERRRRIYSGLAAPESDEYLSFPLEQEDGNEETALPEDDLLTARLLGLVAGAFEDDDYLGRDDLQRERPWLFYVVVVELEDFDEPVGFVRQYNPRRGFKAGRLLTSFHDTLSRLEDPVLNFDFDFDLVVAPDELAILNTTAFQRVFADAAVAAAEVPGNVEQVTSELGVELEENAEQVVEDVCREKASLARRLRRIARLSHLEAVTPDRLREKAQEHGLPADRFGTDDVVELKDEEDVRTFFDMLEQRYYEGDFTDEHLRADRISPRP